MVRHLIAALCLLLISSGVNAVQVGVGVDRNPVNLDESFTLVFRSNESPDDDPDFGPIEKDFELVSQQKKQQLSWVNGESNHVHQWVLKLIAKRAGKLQIPSISFGDDHTDPLEISVNKIALNESSAEDSELFLQVEVAAEQHYVQSQIIYTVRFYRRVQVAQASLSEPEVENAIVEKLGEDRSYNKQVNGVNYLVTERQYAIFSQKSGRLKIPPLALSAQIMLDQRRSRFNSYFNSPTTRTKRARSNAIELEVLAAPEEAKSRHWLPAEQLTLQQHWSNEALEAKVGEPITRTITIKAKGVMVSQLPELVFSLNNPHLKVYPDKPLLHDDKGAGGVTAVFQQKIAYIPSEEGRFELPEIEFSWFNRQTQKLEKVGLPATTLTAIAGGAVSVIEEEEKQRSDPEAEQNIEPEQPQEVAQQSQDSSWKWLSLFLAVGWLLTVLFIFLRRNRAAKTEVVSESQQPSLKQALQMLRQACLKNDPAAARRALAKWGAVEYGSTSLDVISARSGSDLKVELDRLNRALFGEVGQDWKGEKLINLVEEVSGREESNAPKGGQLEPLYRG